MDPDVKKLVVIDRCWDCPYHIHDDQRDETKWGKHWCEKVDAEVVDAHKVPEWCPLPNA